MVAPAAGIAVKLNSGGRNSISHYFCYVGDNLPYPCYADIKFRCAPEPSALDRRSQCNLNRRSQCGEGKVSRRSRDESATSLCDVGNNSFGQHNTERARMEGVTVTYVTSSCDLLSRFRSPLSIFNFPFSIFHFPFSVCSAFRFPLRHFPAHARALVSCREGHGIPGISVEHDRRFPSA